MTVISLKAGATTILSEAEDDKQDVFGFRHTRGCCKSHRLACNLKISTSTPDE
ncbi:MAG: hypothetical protein MK179_21500 [Pirellulaceae bacterium]|nr:hypothetical protein [Pirellulaceae bacterium]